MSAEIFASASTGKDSGFGLPAAKLMMVGSVRDLKISRIADGLRADNFSENLYSINGFLAFHTIDYNTIFYHIPRENTRDTGELNVFLREKPCLSMAHKGTAPRLMS